MQPIGVNINVNFLACLMLFLAARPKAREMVAAAAAAVLLGTSMGLHGSVLHRVLEALSYCGAGAIPAVLLMPVISGRLDLGLLGKLLFPPFFGILTTVLLNLGSHGLTYDHFLYHFDGSLGFQPSFSAGTVTAVPWIGQVTRGLYDALPLFLVGAYLVEERRSAAEGRRFFWFIFLLGLCGGTCFLFFPAVGAYWLFAPSFPYHAPPLSAVTLAPTAIAAAVARNCMPSLHTSWALAVLWVTGKCRFPWRTLLRGLLVLMLLQTLVYHYLIDMVVAVPFTLAIYALTRTSVPWPANPRRWAFGVGSASVALWMVALRWAIPAFQVSPAIPWSAALGTIAISLWLWRRLDGAVAAARVSEPLVAAS